MSMGGEVEEALDSNSNSNNTSHKHSRAERFKGVVLQQNGHWGAQIYANHHRIWLGTFKSEIDAAMAYDSAAIKLRNVDSQRNFPWTNISAQEPKFQSRFTTDSVLNMIRNGSYPSKFAHFLRSQQGEAEIGMDLSAVHGDGEFYCNLLFEKELTPSDVSKLNRLVIPKRYAVKHFPDVPNPSKDAKRLSEVQLEFYDRHMRLWTFRYCYWKSSQSFVFTRGWNKFVKKKGLRAMDTVAFYSYESRDGPNVGKSFLVINVSRKDTGLMNGDIIVGEDNMEAEDHKGSKGFRLFGVQIQ